VLKENKMGQTYLTAKMLAERLPYSERHIRDYLKDRAFLEGRHYVRAPGGRKIFFIWERIEEDLGAFSGAAGRIPMAAGGFVHG
jgi:hypothetical protein